MMPNDAARVRFGTAVKSASVDAPADAVCIADAASQDDVAKATTILEDLARTARRRASCENTEEIHATLEEAREKLASLETKRRRSIRTQAALEAAVLAM